MSDNGECKSCCSSRTCAYVVGILGTFLIVSFLVRLMFNYTHPAPLNQARAEERKKNLAEIRQANGLWLTSYDWRDKDKGIVRMPVARAMEISAQEWRNPIAARTNLIGMAAKAYALPPKAPEKPSAFE